MRLEINRVEGLRNDLLLRLERREIDSVLLSISERSRLMALPGIARHRASTTDEMQYLSACRIPIDRHLQRLGVLDDSGTLRRRAVAISNRNLGTNHGNVAWQRGEAPRLFHIQEDPVDYPSHTCLTVWRGGGLSIANLRFDRTAGRAFDASDGRDLSDEIEWATFGQRVLHQGRVTRIEDLAWQFYDIRHVLAFDHHRMQGEEIHHMIYRDYPRAFRDNVEKAWREVGIPRARYFHNAIGLSADAVVILQQEGTAEEIGAALRAAGAEDGLILDNGGSVVCWVWWANLYAGGTISTTVDYRPDGTSAIAFILKGPLMTDLPGGSVSYTVL
jgi:hypothetical protein